MMERKRRLALIFAMVGIAMGTGHMVQMRAAAQAPATGAVQTPAPTAIVPVSAGPEATKAEAPVPPATQAAVVPEAAAPEAAPIVVETADATPPATAAVPAAPVPSPVIVADLSPNLGSMIPKLPLPAAPAPAPPTVEAAPAPVPAPVTAAPVGAAPAAATLPADSCAPSLRLAAAPQAMIGISLVAPCAPDSRIVVSHAGLTITGKTNATGSLFMSLPALEVQAKVTARLPDATEVEQSVRVPAMATMRRMGVQWQNKDAFQLHAFENGAGYGDAGHIWADAPQIPTTGLGDSGGFITLLGDASVDMPMMAEIYTFPAGIAANADVVIEAAVTEATCGRELLGDTIMTLAGTTYVTELTLAMPGCDAVGDILVLKNLLTDLTIAAAN
ncbi:MAG: hypothetical protein ACRC6I_08970 [Paracoccaceae bacterium]